MRKGIYISLISLRKDIHISLISLLYIGKDIYISLISLLYEKGYYIASIFI